MNNAVQKAHDDMQAIAKALISAAVKQDVDLAKVVATQLSYAFDLGLLTGVHMRCDEIKAGLVATRGENPGATHIHTDGCLLEAQQVMHSAIPGIVELPELIADYGHQSFTAGYLQGIEEDESWGNPEEEQ